MNRDELLDLARELSQPMMLDTLPHQAMLMAYVAAGQAITVTSMPGDFDMAEWPRCAPPDEPDDKRMARGIERLADFVRREKGAPTEALYRFAAGEGIHTLPPDAFADMPLPVRFAYETFRAVLVAIDGVIAFEEERERRKHPAPPPRYKLEDTIFEPQDGPFATVSFAGRAGLLGTAAKLPPAASWRPPVVPLDPDPAPLSMDDPAPELELPALPKGAP